MTQTQTLSGGYGALRVEVARLLEVEAVELDVTTNLLDWGLDSIRIMTLIEQFRVGGAEVSFIELAEDPTLGGFARALGIADVPA